MRIIIQKFGGTSVATAESRQQVVRKVQQALEKGYAPIVVVSAMGRKGGVGRSYADAPEIDGTVQLLPPEKISKQMKVGEFTRARIVGVQGHDLVAQPI